jgi:hypothetical protein
MDLFEALANEPQQSLTKDQGVRDTQACNHGKGVGSGTKQVHHLHLPPEDADTVGHDSGCRSGDDSDKEEHAPAFSAPQAFVPAAATPASDTDAAHPHTLNKSSPTTALSIDCSNGASQSGMLILAPLPPPTTALLPKDERR